jgi:hypothetical protein
LARRWLRSSFGAGSMATDTRLRGRDDELSALDRLLEAVRAGESRALVVRGEPGAGKSALLEYVVERASRCRQGAPFGVQSEMELAFAGLHQVCALMLDRLGCLPCPLAMPLPPGRLQRGARPGSLSGQSGGAEGALGGGRIEALSAWWMMRGGWIGPWRRR